ncbi:MAG: DUF1214 domain-containing protein [Alphaproteobacteria bacterium]|nr:DUF1214 domain-containing protein [Alphaproteobacteria bacterium]
MTGQRLIAVAALAAGAVVGAGLALARIDGRLATGDDKNRILLDGWMADLSTGSAAAGPLERARIARAGLFALNASEAVYFVRARDDAGARLDPACDYELAGGALPAEWWSTTLYAEENFLALNNDGAASIQSEEIAPDGGRWRAVISGERPADATPWISSNGAKAFDLTLRLYGPDLAALTASPPPEFPAIRRMACRRATP